EDTPTSDPPCPCSTRTLAASRRHKKAPSRLTWSTRRHSSSDISVNRFLPAVPALATRQSRRPKRSSVWRMAPATSSSSPTSHWNPAAAAPSPSSSATASALRSARRDQTATEPPARATPRAMPSPMPLLPPVTTTTRPERSIMAASERDASGTSGYLCPGEWLLRQAADLDLRGPHPGVAGEGVVVHAEVQPPGGRGDQDRSAYLEGL